MSAIKKRHETLQQLDNPSWKKETFLNGLVVLHTIKCEKASHQIMNKLQENDYVLEERKKSRKVVINKKHPLTPTEMQEVRIDKLKVTEGSLVSVIRPNGQKVFAINENEPVGLHEQLPLATQTQSDFKTIEHESFIFKQEVSREKNSFFFKAKDGENLYVLGDNFYKDFKAGFKHFSFANLGASEAQKKSILGVASFMFYFENLRILIVTHSMDKSYFNQFKVDSYKITASIAAYPEFEYEMFHHEGLNYLEAEEIITHSEKHKVKGVEYLVKKIVEDYDVVFYDLPTIAEIKSHYEIYFPILQMVENVTFTVNVKSNSYSEIDELKKFFSNYKILLKGLIVENQHEEGK